MTAHGAAAAPLPPPVPGGLFPFRWPTGALRLPLREVLLVLAAWTTFVPVFATRVHHFAEGESTWSHAFLVAAVDLYLWAVLCLAAWALARAFPLRRERWPRLVAVHLAGAVGLALFRVIVEQRLECMLGSPDPCFVPEVIPYRGPMVVFFYLQILGTMYAVEFARRLHHREVASAQMERELSRAQLRALRAHLQPHFLFNTLNAVVSLVRRDPDGAEEMIGDLGDLLRASLVHEQTHEVTLRQEMKLLDPYLRIQQVRFGPRLRVERCVDPAALNAAVPPMVLQPLVENAIRHGVARAPGAGRVRIAVTLADGALRMLVEDDGPGFAQGWIEGVGLGSTRARLQHQYAGAARLETREAEGGGAVVEVTLPYRAARDVEEAA